MRKPNLFIVGAPKAGTTALYHYLKIHPEIYFPDLKEPSFFGSDLPFKKLWYGGDIDNYLDLYENAKYKNVIGDASTCYFYSTNAAAEIMKFNPKAKIIIMLRNPFSLMQSLHNEMVNSQEEDITNFESALKAEPRRKSGKAKIIAINKKIILYSYVANYNIHVRRFINLFGKKNVQIVIFEKFVTNTPQIYKRLLKFLNVDSSFKVDFKKISTGEVKNSYKTVKVKFLERFINTEHKTYRKLFSDIVPLSTMVKVTNLIRKMNTKFGMHPKPDEMLRKKISQKVKPQIEKLEILTGENLSIWYK